MPLRHSSSSSSSRKRVPLAPLPAHLQLLEQLSLSLTASKSDKCDVRYELRVTHMPSGVSWRHRRSYEQYSEFQQRLLRAMKQGHFCHAECPYLYTFVKSYFPRPAVFGAANACVMEKRRDALEQCFVTLQKFLVSRANLSCAVLSEDAAREVMDFVVGDVANPKHPLHVVIQQQQEELRKQKSADFFSTSGRSSCLSFVSSTSDESESGMLEASGCPCICSICNLSLDGEAFSEAASPANESGNSHGHSGSSRGSSLSLGSRCSSLSYTTTLACGHVFHDECIVAKLNEDMACPTCGVTVISF